MTDSRARERSRRRSPSTIVRERTASTPVSHTGAWCPPVRLCTRSASCSPSVSWVAGRSRARRFVERMPATIPDAVAQPIDGGGQWEPSERRRHVPHRRRSFRSSAAHDRGESSVDAALFAGRSPGGVRRVRQREEHEQCVGDGSRCGHDASPHRRRRTTATTRSGASEGATVAYSVSAPDGKDLLVRPVGAGDPSVLAARAGTQFASDWLRDGSALARGLVNQLGWLTVKASR